MRSRVLSLRKMFGFAAHGVSVSRKHQNATSGKGDAPFGRPYVCTQRSSRPSHAGRHTAGLRHLQPRPNYVSSVAVRWERFPISVSVNTPGNLTNLSPVARALYTDGMRLGVGLWLSGFLGRMELTTDDPDAQLQVSVVDTLEPTNNLNGYTVHHMGSAGGRSVIARASITIQRMSADFQHAERLLARNLWSPLDFSNHVSIVTAHETGHALGIVQHSPSTNDLMSQRGSPQLWVNDRPIRISRGGCPTPTATP